MTHSSGYPAQIRSLDSLLGPPSLGLINTPIVFFKTQSQPRHNWPGGSMSGGRHTLWEVMREKGYSRRDFMQFCTFAAAAAGLSPNASAAVAKAFEKKARPPVIWLHFQECTCCSESFIRASHPIVADVLLDAISLDYTETLQAAAGHQAEKGKADTLEAY